jgi:uncharacterized protein (DUF1778 family)
MSGKEARLDFRLDSEVKDRIERAAKLAKESTSAFVVRAAAVAADQVLARADTTVMPAEQFDELLASLDVPEEAPALAQLGRNERRYMRK